MKKQHLCRVTDHAFKVLSQEIVPSKAAADRWTKTARAEYPDGLVTSLEVEAQEEPLAKAG